MSFFEINYNIQDYCHLKLLIIYLVVYLTDNVNHVLHFGKGMIVLYKINFFIEKFFKFIFVPRFKKSIFHPHIYLVQIGYIFNFRFKNFHLANKFVK